MLNNIFSSTGRKDWRDRPKMSLVNLCFVTKSRRQLLLRAGRAGVRLTNPPRRPLHLHLAHLVATWSTWNTWNTWNSTNPGHPLTNTANTAAEDCTGVQKIHNMTCFTGNIIASQTQTLSFINRNKTQHLNRIMHVSDYLICFLVKKLYNIRDTLFPDSDPLLELPQAMLSLNIPSSASTTTTKTTATTTISPTTTLSTTATTGPPPPRLTTARQSTRTLAAGASPREEIRKVSHQKVGRPEGQRV